MVPELGVPPLAGESEATGELVSASQVIDTERIAAAQSYIDALVSHDASDVPFASGCTRIEIGLKTGFPELICVAA